MYSSIPDDVITPAVAVTLHGLFRQRLQHSGDAIAYRYFDQQQERWCDLSWREMASEVARWQAAMQALSLQPGERVAVMARNCPQWVMFEQAALGLGLVVVPLYVNDRPGNVAYILNDANVRLLLLENGTQWRELQGEALPPQLYIWSLEQCGDERVHHVDVLIPPPPRSAQRAGIKGLGGGDQSTGMDVGACDNSDHHPPAPSLKEGGLKGSSLQSQVSGLITYEQTSDALATIVYTSGTTGRPKGVMLSHGNILWNAYIGVRAVNVRSSDLFLSFLPLSHTLERTIGYYLPMMVGATVAYARSIQQLAQDLEIIKPTVLISVPRIYERTYAKINEQLQSPLKRKLFTLAVESGWRRFQRSQGRGGWSPLMLLRPLLAKVVAQKIIAKLGGRLRIAICGGAPMPEHIGKTFIGLGLNLLQGYGMTEFSPVVSVNLPNNNDPLSVGLPLPEVEIRIGKEDELLVRGPCVMLGYWNNAEATADVIDGEGWLHTGDKARILEGRIYITGRLKDVLVLANGEKVPPADMEMAISSDPLFEQVMVIGDNRPYLTALVVLNKAEVDKRSVAEEKQLLDVLGQRLAEFPGYAQIRKVAVVEEPWTVENEMLTPTLKLKRARIVERHQGEINQMYKGH